MDNEEETKPAQGISPWKGAAFSAAETSTNAFRGLSQALMQGAFEKFGEAFTDTGDRTGGRTAGSSPAMEGFRQAGVKAASAMENRWHRMEFDSFENKMLKPYVQGKKAIQQQFSEANEMLDDGIIMGPNGPEQVDLNDPLQRDRLVRKRGELFSRFMNINADMDMTLANEAAKYPTNPIIDKRLQNIIETTTEMLQTIAYPAETLAAEKGYSDIRTNERMAAASERQAGAAEKQADAAAKQKNEPKNIHDVINHPDWGVPRVLEWLTTGPGSQLLYGDVGGPIATAKKEEYRAALLASGKYTDDGEGSESRAKLDAAMARGAEDIRNATAIELLRSVDPRAVEAAKAYAPQFFKHEGSGSDTGGPRKGIIGKERQTKKSKGILASSWKDLASEQLDSYLKDPSHAVDLDAAIAYVIEEWLPQALVGQTDDNIPVNILFAQDQDTSKQRRELSKELREYLIKNWQKSEVAREAFPVSARAQQGGAHPGGIRGWRSSARRAKREGLGLDKGQ